MIKELKGPDQPATGRKQGSEGQVRSPASEHQKHPRGIGLKQGEMRASAACSERYSIYRANEQPGGD